MRCKPQKQARLEDMNVKPRGLYDIYREGNTTRGFHHCSLFGGAPVAAAGEMSVRNGILLAVTPKSGHYQPRRQKMMNLSSELRYQGVNPGNVKFQNLGQNSGTVLNLQQGFIAD